MPASSENSRSSCCERARKGTSISSEDRNTTQIIEPMVAMPCCTPGWRAAAAIASVSSTSVPSVTMPKRRSSSA